VMGFATRILRKFNAKPKMISLNIRRENSYILKVHPAKFHAVKHYLKQCKCQFKIKNDYFVIDKISKNLIAEIARAAAIKRPV
jgi:hypothetical protein